MVRVSCLNRFSTFRASLVTFALLTGLAGCGGGGGGSKPSLSIEGTTVTEGDADNIVMNFTVTLSEEAAADLTFSYHTGDGTAEVAEGDYTAANGTLTIAKGSRTANASIPVYVNGDDDFEADETIQLIVNNAQGISLDQPSYSGTGAITNDDDADPAGYYTGSANVNGTSLNVTAMVYNKRILMFNTDENVLYDINLDTVTLTTYSASAQVYVNGDIAGTSSRKDVSLTGSTDEANISGSFSGSTGFGEGSFTLSYDDNNNTGATLARIETLGLNQWSGNLYSVDTVIGSFGFDASGEWGGGNNNVPVCIFGGDEAMTIGGSTTIPSSSVNIFQISNHVFDSVNCNYVGNGYTGLGSVIDVAGTDDGLVFAETNGTYAVFSVMTRTP